MNCSQQFDISNVCISSRQRAFVKEYLLKDFRCVRVPKKWIDLLKYKQSENRQAFIELMSYIFTRISNNNFVFTEIDSENMNAISRDYKEVVDLLVQNQMITEKISTYVNSNGILVSKNVSLHGQHSVCKAYGCYPIKESDFVNIEVSSFARRKVKKEKLQSEYSILQSEMFDKITLDFKLALEAIQPYRKMPFDSKQGLITLIRIYKKDTYIHPAQNNLEGRIYHSFNGLSKNYRKYLETTEGSKFKTLDMVAAQPSIFASYFKKYNNDCKAYYELLKTGRIYDIISNEIKVSAEEIKEMFMTIMFSAPEIKIRYKRKPNKLETWFSTNYPGFLSVVAEEKIKLLKEQEMKNNLILSTNKDAKIIIKDSGTLLSYKYSKIETLIMKEVFEKCPGIKITIHDEIMVEEQFYEESKIIFESAIQKHNLPSRTK